MAPTPPKRNRFKPVQEGARKALKDILALGLPADIAERTVERIFRAPLEDAMELTHGDGKTTEVQPTSLRRGKSRTEGQ